MRNLTPITIYSCFCFIFCFVTIANSFAFYPGPDKFSEYVFQKAPADTGKKPVSAQATPKKQSPEINRKNLFKVLADALKLRKNARDRERQRMIALIDTLGIKDSIHATSNNLQILITELSKSENQHYDSLQKIISSIKLREDKPDFLDSSFLDFDPAAGNNLSNKDIETLVNQIVPLLAQKANEENVDKQKKESLRLIKQAGSSNPNTVHVQKQSDSVILRFKVSLKKRADVFGFYDYSYTYKDLPPPFGSLYSLIYYALPLDGATGNFESLNGWDTAPVITAAQQAGCKVHFTVLYQNKTKTAAFLYNMQSQQKFLDNVILQLKNRNGNGINISFKNLVKRDKQPFLEFIQLTSKTLKQANPDYQLYVTVPRFDEDGAYEITGMNEPVDKFFVDFATNTSSLYGPLAPLKGKQNTSIETAVSRYEAQGIDAGKLVLILPYRGTRWRTTPLSPGKDYFIDYLKFNEIQKNYDSPVLYDEESSTAYIDTVDSRKNSYRIWFDNANTLGKKYDFILENKLGGVALYFINYDDAYTELRDELIYKFTSIDTVYLKNSVVASPKQLSFTQKAYRYLVLFDIILKNPCATSFTIPTSKTNDSLDKVISSYIVQLKIDSLMKEKEARDSTYFKHGRHSNEFHYINDTLNYILFFTTVFFLVFTLIMFIFYIYGLKYNGDEWRLRKTMAGLLIILWALLVLSFFMFCFTSDWIPYFGSSTTADDECINIPFFSLLLIIIISIAIGVFLHRYLISSFFKVKDIP